jgi:hypothetical protein
MRPENRNSTLPDNGSLTQVFVTTSRENHLLGSVNTTYKPEKPSARLGKHHLLAGKTIC